MMILRDYNSYFSGDHIFVKSRFELVHEDVQAEPLALIQKRYIQQHMAVRHDTEQNDIPMFLYEKLEPKDLKRYQTKDELLAFLKKYFLVTWDSFEVFSKKGNQAFLEKVLFPQLDISTECCVINADEIDEEKTNVFGRTVYTYYLLLMWKDSPESLNIGIMFSD